MKKNSQKKNRLYSFLKGFFYLPGKILFPTVVIGKRNVPKGKHVAIANHLKWTDIVLMVLFVPGYRHILGKKELSKNKFLNFICKKLEVIFVDRGAADISSIRTTVNYLKKDEAVALFPEGTRNRVDESVQDVKAGAVMFAVKGEAPVLPIVIHAKSRFFHRNYMMIASQFDFSEYYGQRLTPDILAEGADKMANILKLSKQILDFAVTNGEIKKLISIDKSFAISEKLYKRTIKKHGAKK